MREVISKIIKDSILVKQNLNIKSIETAAKIIIEALRKGNKILICGNGGSAAQAQHFTAELVGRFEKERKPLPAIALTTDTSNLTAISNDYGFDEVFSRQVKALGKKGDVLFCLSTSGNSKNVFKAIQTASSLFLTVTTLLGNNGGEISTLAAHHIIISESNTARIQEAHLLIIHILCKLIEDELCRNS